MSVRLLSRRAVLGTALALPWARALAFGDTARFVPAVAKHGGKWDVRLSGLRRLTWELQRRTSVEVLPEARALSLSSPKLFEHPFLYLGADGELPPLAPSEVENLRRYLNFGGFLLADANDAAAGRFDTSFRRELARVLPQSPLSELPAAHVVYKSFFLLDSPPGRVLDKPFLEGAYVGKRAAVIYSQNDLAGAWSRDETGDFEFEVVPGGDAQREIAFRLGINLCMYALCLDYKDDAVHLRAIIDRRR